MVEIKTQKQATAYMEEFAKKYEQFRTNRAKVPLDQLTQGKYAKAYNNLVNWIREYATWYANIYVRMLKINEDPADTAGNEALHRKMGEVLEQEYSPGGLYPQAMTDLIDRVDRDGFEDKIWRIHDRLEKEVYDPYQQRFNRWVGNPGNRWIYNSLFDAYWFPDPEYSEGGYWVKQDGHFARIDYPPRIGPDVTAIT